MALVANGDARSFEVLHERHSALVFLAAQRIVRDRQSAEDVRQEAFLRVWQHAARFRPDRGPFVGWLLRITRHLAIDAVRRRGRLARPGQGFDHELLLASLVDPRLDVEAAADLNWLRTVIAAAVGRLPVAQRRAVELAYVQGLTHREIAASLNEPLGTVKSRVLLGARKVRHELTAVGAAP